MANLSYHPLYSVWRNMKNRCNNRNTRGYEDYGGRGITVCEQWNNDFVNFIRWAYDFGNYEHGLQLDRINNEGNYEPNNCRFTTPQVNMNNRRDRKTKNKALPEEIEKWFSNVRDKRKTPRSFSKTLTFNGESKTVKEWASITGISTTTIHKRLELGWTTEEIITTPTRAYRADS